MTNPGVITFEAYDLYPEDNDSTSPLHVPAVQLQSWCDRGTDLHGNPVTLVMLVGQQGTGTLVKGSCNEVAYQYSRALEVGEGEMQYWASLRQVRSAQLSGRLYEEQESGGDDA